MFASILVIVPFIFVSPFTSNFFVGDVVPIPTLPLITFNPPVIPPFSKVVTSEFSYCVISELIVVPLILIPSPPV